MGGTMQHGLRMVTILLIILTVTLFTACVKCDQKYMKNNEYNYPIGCEDSEGDYVHLCYDPTDSQYTCCNNNLCMPVDDLF